MATNGKRKRRSWKRNKRRRAKLMALGFTEAEARALIDAEGKMLNEKNNLRARRPDARAEHKAREARERQLYPTQPTNPQSVRAISTAFEHNRRKH